MSVRTLTTEQVLQAAEDSDIVHLICCRDSHPTRALCGWLVTEEAHDDDELECVVCCDIADGYGENECVRGGKCP